MKLKTLLLLVPGFLMLFHPAFSQTSIPGGNISGTWTQAGSPYLIDGDLLVPAGQTLTIEPGVEVLFNDSYALTVKGRLVANGTPSDSIRFGHSETYLGEWKRIKFYDTETNGQDSCIMNYCVIEDGTHYEDTVARGGGLYLFRSSDLRFSNSEIRDCHAPYGGGLAMAYSSPLIRKVVIKNNTAWGHGNNYGGGIWIASGSSPIIEYCLIFNNAVLGEDAWGGGIALVGGDPIMTNITVYGNQVSGTLTNHGDGIYAYDPTGAVLKNSIVWNNGQEIYIETGTFNIQYSDVEGGFTGTGNLDYDPEFVDPASGDFSLSWNFPHSSRSMCINKGDPSSPPDADGSRADMGAVPYIIPYGTYFNGGDFCGTMTTAGSPWIIEGAVNVPVGCELTVQHGVEAIFWYREPLNVHGRLEVQGESWDRVRFTDGPSGWKGIRFFDTNSNGQDSSRLEHFLIDYVFFADEHAGGGGLFFQNSSNVSVSHCEIANCFIVGSAAAYGAGIYCDHSSPVITNAGIHDNEIEGPFALGGAIYCHTNSNPKITNALIHDNNLDATEQSRGGGIMLVNSDPVLVNLTIARNTMSGTLQQGGAIYMDGSDPVIRNAIFWGNDNSEIYLEGGSSPGITYSDIQGGSGEPWFGTGCIDSDPLFADAASGDFHLTWDNYPTPDGTKSPCIDTGDPLSSPDPDGTPRDMGALYFYQAYHLCGSINGILSAANSPYLITCDVAVESTEQLVIEPGVEIIFLGNYAFKVYGRLLAGGTESDSIVFSAFDGPTGWRGIRFHNTETNGLSPSLLSYCHISGGVVFDDFSGGIDEWGGGVLCYNSSDLTIEHCTIEDNRAFGNGLGGGIYCYQSDITLSHCAIRDNYAGYSGGGLYLNASDVDMDHVVVTGNYAPTQGAGIYLFMGAAPAIDHVTVADNWGALFGGGLYIDNSSPVVTNSIIWGNDNVDVEEYGTCSTQISYSDVEGGWTGTSNIALDPLFSDPAENDYSLSWDHYPDPDDSRSPCIDAGNPLAPLDPDGTDTDMGAMPFEQTYTVLAGGDISGTITCAGSPYRVTGDLTVPAGQELEIEPCVYLIFAGKYRLNVYGRLLAIGTPEQKITFYPADTTEGWMGIRFYNLNTNGQDSSKLVHCRLRHGNADGYNQNGQGGGVYATSSSSLLISDCFFYGNRSRQNGGGIFLVNSSNPLIRRTVFQKNRSSLGGAIGCYASADAHIQNCRINNNLAEYGGGISAAACGPTLEGTSIFSNRATKFGGGLYRSGGQVPVFSETNRCNFYDNYADLAGFDFFTNPDVYVPPVTIVFLDSGSVASYHDRFAFPIHLFDVELTEPCFLQTAADLYVDPAGSDDNTGTSAAVPLKTLKRALNRIVAGPGSRRTVYLADGTYSRSGTGETLPVNLSNHVTIRGESREGTILDGEDLFQLMTSYGDINDSVTTLTLQHGYREGDGGALHVEHYTNPTFHEISLQNNYSTNHGGAAWCYDHSSPVFSSVLFINNYSDNSGGGLYSQTNDTLVIRNVVFASNTARHSGGGMYAGYDDYCRIISTDYIDNDVFNGDGGGFRLANTVCRMDSVLIQDNVAIGYGGGSALGGTELYAFASTWQNNSADGHGGGIYAYYGNHMTMQDVVFNANASYDGGGIYSYYGSSLTVKNGLFINNITVVYPYSDGQGGAMYLNDVETSLTNVTLAGNISDGDGGGIFCSNDNYSFDNSIFWNNSPDQVYVYTGTVVEVNYCDIEGGWPSGAGNIDADPGFAMSGDSYYSLDAGSPCIDAGNPDTTGMNLPLFDLEGNPRICSGTIDMGAYEYFNGIETAVKVFLQGPHQGSQMATNLMDLGSLPFMQPYSQAPWSYGGPEEVSSFPDPDVVDWLLLEVRDAADVTLATPATTVGRQAVFLLSDGTVTGINGFNPRFGNQIANNCYVVIWHRNHLPVISANPLTEIDGVHTYDFTTSVEQAYGTNAQIDLGGGIYGLYGGDGDASGLIDGDDKTAVWEVQAGRAGYRAGDFNLDGQVDNRDKDDVWLEGQGQASQLPE